MSSMIIVGKGSFYKITEDVLNQYNSPLFIIQSVKNQTKISSGFIFADRRIRQIFADLPKDGENP